MGIVALTLKVMPEGPQTNMEAIKAAIKKEIKVKEIREKPLGFGLKYLEVLLLVEDVAGGSSKIEEIISCIPGVASVEAEDITLL